MTNEQKALNAMIEAQKAEILAMFDYHQSRIGEVWGGHVTDRTPEYENYRRAVIEREKATQAYIDVMN